MPLIPGEERLAFPFARAVLFDGEGECVRD